MWSRHGFVGDFQCLSRPGPATSEPNRRDSIRLGRVLNKGARNVDGCCWLETSHCARARWLRYHPSFLMHPRFLAQLSAIRHELGTRVQTLERRIVPHESYDHGEVPRAQSPSTLLGGVCVRMRGDGPKDSPSSDLTNSLP